MSATIDSKQKVKIYEIATKMKHAGLRDAFIDAVVTAASSSQAISDMMRLWSRERSPKERDEIVADLQDMIDDSQQESQLKAAYIRFDDLEQVAKHVMAFKESLLLIVHKRGGLKRISELTEIPQPSLSRFFNSASMPHRTTLLKLRDALKLDRVPLGEKWIRTA